MNDKVSIALFYLLKEEVSLKYISLNVDCKRDVHRWTREDILNFQEYLSENFNERISERWIYSHLKPKVNEKLPRIDTLNLLCKYISSNTWDSFVKENKDNISLKDDKKSSKKHALKTGVILFIVSIIIGIVIWSISNTKNTYRFCFHNKDTRQPIIDNRIDIFLFNENESPLTLYSDENGCFEIETDKEFIKFAVKSQYYKVDTVERFLEGKSGNEIIELSQDDYALMIQLYSTSNMKDWEKRRNQLNTIIHDDAVIFQVAEDYAGMEMYNKEEFINKLTTPLKSLGKIEIIETVYDKDKIMNIRFIQK